MKVICRLIHNEILVSALHPSRMFDDSSRATMIHRVGIIQYARQILILNFNHVRDLDVTETVRHLRCHGGCRRVHKTSEDTVWELLCWLSYIYTTSEEQIVVG